TAGTTRAPGRPRDGVDDGGAGSCVTPSSGAGVSPGTGKHAVGRRFAQTLGPCRPGRSSRITREQRRVAMPQYLYQVAYTPESLAAQIKKPQDRLQVVGKQLSDAVGAKIVAGGYSCGEYDIAVIVEAAD